MEEKARILQAMGAMVIDDGIPDQSLRQQIYKNIPKERLQVVLIDSYEIVRAEGMEYFDFLDNRYSYIRQFAPTFLREIPFEAVKADNALLKGINILKEMNEKKSKKLPQQVPTDFIPNKWNTFVFQTDQANRRAYELCLLSSLREKLRSGDIYLAESKRFVNPDKYLIDKQRWKEVKAELCQQLHLTETGIERVNERKKELISLLASFNELMGTEMESLKIENGALKVSKLKGEDPSQSSIMLESLLSDRLPRIELTDLLVEVDGWTGFSKHFEHASTMFSSELEFMQQLYASVLAKGSNIEISEMSQSTGFTYERLAWLANWYIREETLKKANDTLVNFHYEQPLSKYWGGGILSSSDGQRIPVSGKIRNAVALPKYFGYGRGITCYTWTSDQYSQYGTKVISSTVRDATYVLDEILDNQTQLNITEHTTDTAGYTDLVFALFDLLGMRFSPRIKDIGGTVLYKLSEDKLIYENIESILTGRVNLEFILKYWEDLLRVAGSLKSGWVTSSLLISKLQANPQQNHLTKVLQEYGKLIKTIFILRYLQSEAYQRRIGKQLNKGEKMHDLRRFIGFGGDGKIRKKQLLEQTNLVGCLNVITNAIVVWNTVYLNKAVKDLESQDIICDIEDLAHLSPARYAHINRYGKYEFDMELLKKNDVWRPLRP